MFQSLKVSSVEAMKLIHHALDQVSKDGRQIAIAISGPEGELIAFTRMDGASPAASKIARNKAYTAAVDRKDTRLMNDFMQGAQRPQAYWGDESITGFGGGVTIKHQDKVIGGMGISGLTEDEDEEIANKAIAAVFRIIN